MKKNKVIICSNSGIDYLPYNKDIEIFRSKINFKDDSYNDFVDLSAKDFYERLKLNPNDIPSTSYVSIGHMIETFERLEKDGYTDVLVITIAKPLSGLYDQIINISKEFKMNIVAYNSKTLAYPEALMAIDADKMLKNGKTLEEVITHLDFIRDNNKFYFAVDTLLYLVKNGRLSKLQGTLGTMLSIKPVLTISKEGTVETLEKIRTTPKAIKRIVELYLEETKDKDVISFISHAHNDNGVKKITEMIHKVYPNREIISSYLTPVVGAHTGPNAISIGYILKESSN